MKNVQSWILCLSFVLVPAPPAAAADPAALLSPAEEHLAVQIGFEKDILLLVKEVTGHSLHRLSGYDEDEYQIMANGFVATVVKSQSDQVLWSLRERLKPRKYMAFLIESINALKTDKLAIIKGTDPYDILAIMHTNGDVDDLSHEDVMERLREWGKQCPFEIIGAENDWVEIEFRTLPGNLKAFVEEVYEFSPDAVGEGTANAARLIKEISATKRLMLWWE
ncbi:MAG: DUF4253 domain-containing protein [Nitrospirota bacterium]